MNTAVNTPEINVLSLVLDLVYKELTVSLKQGLNDWNWTGKKHLQYVK